MNLRNLILSVLLSFPQPVHVTVIQRDADLTPLFTSGVATLAAVSALTVSTIRMGSTVRSVTTSTTDDRDRLLTGDEDVCVSY